MMFEGLDLTVIWAGIIAFAIAAYVVMDGFDLGIGLLFPTIPVGEQRDRAMNTIAPVWDGNETWLVLGGGGLMAAFPLAYAILLPALYIPMILMLLGLVFRGVAFEFRWRDPRHRAAWDVAFFGGSVIATFMQGVALGAVLQGVEVQGRAFAGGPFDWMTPFSVFTGLSLLAGYGLLGAGWLIWKTEHDLHLLALRRARILLPSLVIAIVVVSVFTPFLDRGYFARWFDWPGILWVSPVPILVALVTFIFWRGLGRSADHLPFFLTLALFGLTLAGLGISIWPDVVPGSVSIWDAATARESQAFMLVGAGIMIPIILGYTGWAYWVFRGKVEADGYH